MAECLGLLRQENSCSESCSGRGELGGLIVDLNRGQFIDQLFIAVELANFAQMNFVTRRVKPRVDDLASPLMSSH